MIRRSVLSGIKAREELAVGAKFLAECVGNTLGIFGSNFFLDKKNSITNDGVTIAREIQISSCVKKGHNSEICFREMCSPEIQNRGALAIREAAIKTVDEVGDGTTTAITFAYAIYDVASRLLSKEGVVGKKTPAEIVKQIEAERIEITEKLIAQATPIETKEQLINSAIVAVEDKELGTLIGEAQWSLGKDGYLMVEETAERTSSVERVSGIRIDNGFGTSQIVNNEEKQTLEVSDTKIILTSHTIKDLNDWEKIMKLCLMLAKAGTTQVVIIARAWTDLTVNFCLQNINKGTIKIYPLSAPYVDMQERFKDLSAVLGATFYDSESYSLDDMQFSDVGFASKVTARRMDAVIAGKNDDATKERIAKRVAELKDKQKGSDSDFEKKALSERIAQMENGFAIVKVGSSSDMERRRLFDKCDDAVHAVRAAFQEGTVKGGGLAYKEIADTLPDTYILKRPLMAPYEQIMSSAPAVFIIEDWVRDPVKVMRVALERACAAAASLATAGGVITQEFPKRLDEVLKLPNTPHEN